MSKKGFTLIELLIVIAILSVLAAAVLFVINPVELIAQARDTTRSSDLGTIAKAVDITLATATGTAAKVSLGTPNTVYISIADASSTCGDLSLPALASGWSYSCVAQSSLLKTDGTGWIPINFKGAPTGSQLTLLPIDPVNSAPLGLYYTYVTNGTSWQIAVPPESQKYKSNISAGSQQTIGGVQEITSGSDLSLIGGSVPSTQSLWATKISGSPTIFKVGYNGTVLGSYAGVTSGLGQAIDNSGHVWTTDYSGSKVVKMNVADGSVAGTYTVGSYPYGVAIDASDDAWVVGGRTNGVSDYVYKISPTGTISGPFGVGTVYSPIGVAVDSSNHVWVANEGNSTVTEFNSSTGAIIGTYCSSTNCAFPYDIAADSSGDIWVSGYSSGTATVTKLNASNGAFIAKYTLPASSGDVQGMAADPSGNIWVTSSDGATTTKVRISDGTALGEYSTGQHACQYGFGGTAADSYGNIWIASYCGYLVEVTGSTGAVAGTYPVGGVGIQTIGDFTGYALQHFVLGH